MTSTSGGLEPGPHPRSMAISQKEMPDMPDLLDSFHNVGRDDCSEDRTVEV